MKTKYFLILFVLVFACFGFKCNKGSVEDGVFNGKVYDDVQAITPKGAKVLSRTEINPDLLSKADDGLDKLFDVSSRLNGYQIGLDHSLYNIYLFPRSYKCETAAFLVSADDSPYDGTEWDKDPRVGKVTLCAAGLMANGSTYSMLVVDDVDTIPIIVRYEGEHLVLLHNDYDRFTATMYHIGNGHPLMPDETGNRAVQSPFRNFTITLQQPIEIGGRTLPVGTTVCFLLTK